MKIEAALQVLMDAAGWAPSGDNVQPWRFEVDGFGARLLIHIDESRDPSPMNAGQRMSRLALGAATQNVFVAASSRGWEIEIQDNEPPVVITLRAFHEGGVDDAAIRLRVTNRQLYKGGVVSPPVVTDLKSDTPLLAGVSTVWVCEQERILALAHLIGQADALMFSSPQVRQAFLKNVRFDRPTTEEVEEGLALGCLGLRRLDQLMVRTLQYVPDHAFRLFGIGRKFRAAATKLVRSASGVCIGIQSGIDRPSDIQVGRAMQQAWLTLTRGNFAVQPMMSLVVLENMLQHGLDGMFPDRSLRRQFNVLREKLTAIVPELRFQYPGFLLRFGFAPRPATRTGRLLSQSACPSEG